MVNNTWFQISNQGWKRINAGRPLGHLVREAISNVFDAPGVSSCEVVATPGEIRIKDNSPQGIQDRELITTVFMTDKEDSHLMRGRKGRGLKELIAAADHARVATIGYAVDFNADGTRSTVDSGGTEVGTLVKVYNEEWREAAIAECVSYLLKFIPPVGITMTVNGVTVRPPTTTSTIFDAKLPTTIIQEGKQVEIERNANVNVMALKSGEKKGWVYEMGIPIQEVDTDFSLDVAQRVPMNDNRDVVDAKYLPQLYAAVLKTKLNTIDRNDLTEKWILAGLQVAGWSLQDEYVARLVPEGYAIKSDDKMANDKARQHGIKLVDLSMLPSDSRWTIAYHGKDAKKLMKEIEDNSPITDREDLRQEHIVFVAVMEYLAQKLLDKPIRVTFMSKLPSYNGSNTIADFNSVSGTMRWNMDLEKTYFDQPIHPENLTTLIHELAHDKYGEHNDLFLEEVQTLAGKLAVLCMTYQQTLYRMVSQVAKDTTKQQHSSKTVVCTWPGCSTLRLVKPQDVHQVKYCEDHQKAAAKNRAKERREAKKANPW